MGYRPANQLPCAFVFIIDTLANSVNPEEMPSYTTFILGLDCLLAKTNPPGQKKICEFD